MPYRIIFSKEFEKSMKKLKKKDIVMFDRINKKTAEIISNPERFKPLANILAGNRRIHFDPFVLVFRIEGDRVLIKSIDHHDKAY